MKHKIGILYSHKNLNTTELRNEVLASIKMEAQFWRNNGLPHALSDLLLSKGINLQSSIVIDLETDAPGNSNLIGKVATRENEIFEFELDCNSDKTAIINIDAWSDITDQVNSSTSNKGFKYGLASIIFQALKEINDQPK
ncbi:MAG: hypothetical protein IPK50_06345 [Fibrobacterota bacterium]|nr:MAG: hypothetical protein IPK50_06345 [Fibrobacterota bacterium]